MPSRRSPFPPPVPARLRRALAAAPRGASLVVVLVIVAVLTLAALAAVNRGYTEVEAGGVRRRYESRVSCIEAARELVVSQFALAGSRLDQLQVTRQVGDLTLSTGHYDSTSAQNQVKVDTNYGNCGTGGAGGNGTGDVTNRNWAPVGTGNACGVRIPVVCRDGSGRALELEFLVRVSL